MKRVLALAALVISLAATCPAEVLYLDTLYLDGIPVWFENGGLRAGEEAGLGADSTGRTSMIGFCAGKNARKSIDCFMAGPHAGDSAEGAYKSWFLVESAGAHSKNLRHCGIGGMDAATWTENLTDVFVRGQGAAGFLKDITGSFYEGAGAGWRAYNTTHSDFRGEWAGQQAENASNSRFRGYHSGLGATGAMNSIFDGLCSGRYAVESSNCIGLGPYSFDGARTFQSIGLGPFTNAGATGNWIYSFAPYAGWNETHSHVLLLGMWTNATADSQAVIGGDLKHLVLPVPGSSITVSKLKGESVSISGMAIASVDTTQEGSTTITFDNGRRITFASAKSGP